MQNTQSNQKKALQDVKKTLADSKQLLNQLSSLQFHSAVNPEINNQESPSKRQNPPMSLNSYGVYRGQDSKIRNGPLSDEQKLEDIRSNVIGFNTEYLSPFKIKLESIYVDHTATNRPYVPVEIMVNYAKKLIANPHTEFSYFGKYSTDLMHYSHQSLLKSFSADPQTYLALPVGSGSTGAVEKAIKIMKNIEQEHNVKPQIFLTPYEHHSNILPWIEFYEKISLLAIDERGTLIMPEIQKQLLACQSELIIVSASAASNVTSQTTKLAELNEIIRKVKKSKQIIFSIDCAAYCCHHELSLKLLDAVDFAFLSPHKNLGGAESCGILLVRQSIITASKPTFPGGGTVAFVKGYTKEDVEYDSSIFNREVSGTPPFLGFYRSALSFELLKDQIGYDFIHRREKLNTNLFIDRIREEDEKLLEQGSKSSIVVYGNCDFNTRANVVTFNIINKGELMQHSFISLILSDIFGIQLRSGCFCAGPFGMKLLKLDQKVVDTLSPIVSLGILKDKPGYLRLDLTFTLEPYEVEYIVQAIAFTARYCQNMLLVYTICNDGEIQRHKLFKDTYEKMYCLSNFSKADLIIQNDLKTDSERLRNRQKTLEFQLAQGKQIIMDPLNFLKAQSHKPK